MPTIKNTTRRPLSVSLPGGKTLRLGPLKSGEVRPSALEHPPILKMVEAGKLEIAGLGTKSPRGQSGGGSTGSPLPQGGRSAGGIRKSGDR